MNFSTNYGILENNVINLKNSMPRAYTFFIVIAFCCTFLLFFANYSTETFRVHLRWPALQFLSHSRHFNNSSLYFNDTSQNFTINTEGCSIPYMTPFDESVKNFSHPIDGQLKKRIKCSTRPLLKKNNTHIWIVNENKAVYNIEDNNYTCCYQQFYRPDSVDNVWDSEIDERVKYAECRNFTLSIEVEDEFVKVTCYSREIEVYNNFFLFARKKTIKLYENDKENEINRSGYNVIVLGIDTLSRLNFHRTMPETLKYLQSKGVVELLGYTKVGFNSYPNIIPMLTGYESQHELPKICYPHKHATYDFCPFLWTQYKRAGYYTALVEDSAWGGTFNYLADGFFRTPTDYYVHTFWNEAEAYLKARPTCIRERYVFEVFLEYIESVIEKVSSSKLFAFFWTISMSHDHLNTPKLMDKRFLELFKGLEQSHYLENTIMFLVSDHGIRWGPIRSTKQGRLEERLPMVYLLAPLSFRNNYSVAFNNLKNNAKRLTTPYDLHEALEDLADLKKLENDNIRLRSKENYAANRGISLFLEIPGNRTCMMASIGEEWCTCIKSNEVSKTTKEAVDAAGHLVEQINKILSEHTQCAKLELDQVIQANELMSGTPDKDELGWREFLVVVRTKPGGGVFESSLRFVNNRDWSLVGMASRINLYGNQSHCVDNPQLRSYCYCKSATTKV